MKKKYLPKRYRNHGLHIWCSSCKKTVTSNPCCHTDKQRFQSRIYNPLTKSQNCIKTHQADGAEKAWELHQAYKKELKPCWLLGIIRR